MQIIVVNYINQQCNGWMKFVCELRPYVRIDITVWFFCLKTSSDRPSKPGIWAQCLSLLHMFYQDDDGIDV